MHSTFYLRHVGSSSLARDLKLRPPKLGAWSPCHWTTWEVPMAVYKKTKGKAHPSYCEAGGQSGWKAGDVLAEVVVLGVGDGLIKDLF